MRFCFGKSDWKDITRGQERCFLLTNGLGGYTSLSMVGSNDRNDQALLMAALVSPNKRYHANSFCSQGPVTNFSLSTKSFP